MVCKEVVPKRRMKCMLVQNDLDFLYGIPTIFFFFGGMFSELCILKPLMGHLAFRWLIRSRSLVCLVHESHGFYTHCS